MTLESGSPPTVLDDSREQETANTAPLGDDQPERIDARLAEIERSVAAAHTSFLERAALVREWAEKYAQKKSGHPCPKSPGRKPGMVGVVLDAMTERVHALTVGKSKEALRKSIGRDLEIASLREEVIEAAKIAGLADRQSHLLKIAKAKTEEAQFEKIETLKVHKESMAARRSEGAKQAAGRMKVVLRIPRDREKEVLSKLIAFADEHGINIIEPELGAA